MYTKVIVPLDGSKLSEKSLPYAQLVARSLDVPVELARAYDTLPPGLLGGQNLPNVRNQLDRAAREQALASLEPVRERLEAAGHSVSVIAQRGSASDVILAIASSDPNALVVMSTHGRGGLSVWVMGSVADKVLHTIPNPLLIVRASDSSQETPETAFQSVVVPLDGSALSELAIPHAISVAGALSAAIRVLHITPTLERYRYELNTATPDVGGLSTLDLAHPEELVAADAKKAETYLADVKNRMEIDHAHGVATEHLTAGDIAETIIDCATEHPSLVVMTTHGRSGVGRMVMGSVTDRVIRSSGAPALVIR